MAIEDSHTKFLVFQQVMMKTKTELTEEQLVIIENVYINDRKNAIFTVGMFRAINACISIIFILLFLMTKGSFFDEWIFVVLMSCFFIYNLIHLWNNIIDYKRIRLNKFKPFKVGKDRI